MQSLLFTYLYECFVLSVSATLFAKFNSLVFLLWKPIEKVLAVIFCLYKDKTKLELSIPPERNIPSGTSETNLFLIE